MANMNHIKTLKEIIIKREVFNSHAHLDRAFTVGFKDVFEKGNKHFLKNGNGWWVQKNATVFNTKNIESALNPKKFDVKRITTFIDVDSVVKSNKCSCSLRYSKEKYDIDLKLACQTLKGVLKKKKSFWDQYW